MRFVDNPITGSATFLDKLEKQLDEAPPEVKQLAAEALWLLLIFVAERKYGIDTKRERIREVWASSGEELGPSPNLQDEVLRGLASPGPAFLTKIWAELQFLLIVVEALKRLPDAERSPLINDPWRLCAWITNFPKGDVRGFRHMLLYFFHPSHFERICSRNHKRKIYAVFANKLERGTDPYEREATPCALDKALLQIRQLLEAERGTPEIDFYVEPLRSAWREQKVANRTTAAADDDDDNPDGHEETVQYSLEDALEELFLDVEEAETILAVWKAKKNLMLQGPPGVGKTFAAQRLAFAVIGAEDPTKVGFVQFHQSYSYEDFIEGYRPGPNGFALREGHFLRFCRRAMETPSSRFVFIIDEVNRGNLSKIFGELLMLIEADKREPRWGLPLAYGSPDQKFYVPKNVHLLGLMNTADRSLAVVDYALRRRFAFHDLSPQFHSAKFRAALKEQNVSPKLIGLICDRLIELNRHIADDEANLGAGFCVGHSFFCAPRDPLTTEDLWYRNVIETEIMPLLREYWFGAPAQVQNWRDRLLAGF